MDRGRELRIVAGLLASGRIAPDRLDSLSDDTRTWMAELLASGELTPADTEGDAPPTSPDEDRRYRPTDAPAREGGIGRVTVHLDSRLGREVAVKELRDGGPTSATTLKRFLREARITAQLEHPNIVPVHDLGFHPDGRPYYSMKVVRGETFATALRGAPGLAGRLRLLGHLVDTCQAVAYAHARGVLHRDLKPDNVMVGAFGETVVLDWGLARVRGLPDPAETAPAPEVEPLTQVGGVLGTPGFMSPEQARGEPLDERSDVWSLGVMLFLLLTGELPYEGPARRQLQLVRTRPPPRVRDVAPDAPAALAAVADRALAYDAALRYPSAAALAEDLQAWQSGGRVSAHRYGSLERALDLAARSPRTAATLATATLLGALGLGAGLLQARQGEATRVDALATSWLGHSEDDHADSDLIGARVFAAASLRLREDPVARGLAIAASAHDGLRLDWRGEAGERCTEPTWSPDGRLSCRGLRALHRWDSSGGEEASLAAEPTRSWVASARAPSGAVVFLADDGGAVRRFDGSTGALLSGWEGVGGVRAMMAMDDETVWSALAELDGQREWTARLVRLGPGEARRTVPLPTRAGLPTGLSLTPDGTTLLVPTISAGIVEVAVADGTPGLGYGDHGYGVPVWDGDRFWAPSNQADGDERGYLFQRGRIDPLDSVDRTPGGPGVIDVSPDGRALALGGRRGELTLLRDLPGLPVWARVPVRAGDAAGVAFSPDGLRVAYTSATGRVEVWELPSRGRAALPDGSTELAFGIALSPDGARVAVSHSDGVVRVYDGALETAPTAFDVRPDGFTAWALDAIRWADDHRLLVSAGAGRGLLQVDSRTGAVTPFDPAAGAVYCFVEAGDVWWAGGSGQTVRRYRGDRLEAESAPFAGSVAGIALRGDALVAADFAGWLHLLDRVTLAPSAPAVPTVDGQFQGLAVAPDGVRFATATRKETVDIWTGGWPPRLERVLPVGATVSRLAWTRSGLLIATGWDHAVRVWETAGFQTLAVIPAHGRASWNVIADPTGRWFWSTGADGRVRRWESALLTADPERFLEAARTEHGVELVDGELRDTP